MAGARKDLDDQLGRPADGPLGAEYEHDFYSWLMEQARHLREGRFEALDCDNLAEEIESLGREQFNKLVSALRVLMAHVLKWDHQTSLRSRSWILCIQEQRLEIADVLSDNPSLKSRIDEAIARAYRRARDLATACPYAFDGLMSRTFKRCSCRFSSIGRL